MTQLSGLKRSMHCDDLCSMTDRTCASSCVDSDEDDDASATSCMVSFPLILQSDDLEFLIDDVLELSIQGASFKRQRRDLTKAPLQPATATLEAALAEIQDTIEQLEYTNIALFNNAYIVDWAALNESSIKVMKRHIGGPYQSHYSCMPCPNSSLTHNLSRMTRTMA